MHLNSDVIFLTSNNSILTVDVWGSMMIMKGEIKMNVEKTAMTQHLKRHYLNLCARKDKQQLQKILTYVLPELIL
jgi:hypothetical protein